MGLPMTCPPAVGRGLLRLGVGVVILASLTTVGGVLLARWQLGLTPADTRARVRDDVTSRVAALGVALDGAVRALAPEGSTVEAAASGADDPVRRLFERVGAAELTAGTSLAALTVYGEDGTPLAWEGRPSSLPASRLEAGAASFLVPTPLGLRLARLEPILAGGGGRRRVGVVVAEAALSTGGAAPNVPTAAVEVQTALVPVLLGPTSGESADPATFTVRTADGSVLGTARVSAADIDVARGRWWGRVAAVLWALGAAALLLAIGPLVDWRGAVRTRPQYLSLSLAVAVAIGGAWWCAGQALTAARVETDDPQRFLTSAMAAAGLTWLVAAALHPWRVDRRQAGGRPLTRAWRLPVHAASGAVVGVALATYDRLIASALPGTATDAVRFALTPLESGRIAAAIGLVLLQATAFVLATAWLDAFSVVAPAAGTGGRRWRLAATSAGAVAGLTWSHAGGGPVWPLLLALAALLGMWRALGLGRGVLRHGSQPARLIVLFAALLLPSLALYPALASVAERGRRSVIEQDVAAQVANQRRDLQLFLRQALDEIDRAGGIDELVEASVQDTPGQVPTDAAFHVWSQTALSERRLTSSVELYDEAGRIVSRFALNLPETSADQVWQESSCEWELFEEVSPFFAEERRLLHAGRGVCVGEASAQRVLGSVVVHVVLDYSNLPFLAAQNPYVALLRSTAPGADAGARDDLAFVAYGWSRRPLFVSGADAWPLSEATFARLAASRDPFWTVIEDRGVASDVYLSNDRGAIYAVGYPRKSLLGHLASLAELAALTGLTFAALLAAITLGAVLGSRAPVSGRALFREVRASFSRTLFLAFVAAVVVPVVALALVTRAYMATSLRADIEREATRTATSASRVVEDFATIESRGASNLPVLDDSLLVWLSRVIGEDINVFAGTGLLASSERNLFASGLLPVRTPGDVYRALVLDGRPTYVTREAVGSYEYLVASAPVRVDDRQAIVSVPLTLRQRGIERQVDELDRRVLLAAIAFILLGSAIGYWAAERISDPVSRLTRATRRLAAGDLDARVLVTSSDELGRLVEAFNGMADDLQRQRQQLERTNRLEAWAEMARQVAHDIKNPLTPIQLNAEHLRRVHDDRARPLGPVLEECVANILLQVRLLRQLASEFSSFASSPHARPEPTPVAPLVEEILAPYDTALAGRIEIERDSADGVPPAMVDRLLLARALTNVIENALHAMPGRGSLRVCVAPEADGRIRIAVSDTGVGMDEAALGRIFEPYFSTKATGTGLGLTIARRNVELNLGTIGVTSSLGRGTTVTMYVPAAPDGARGDWGPDRSVRPAAADPGPSQDAGGA